MVIKRHKLIATIDESKEIEHSKNKKFPLIYYSGFCLTDNLNFAFFDPPQNFILDKGFQNHIYFELKIDDLKMIFDRLKPIQMNTGMKQCFFPGFGLIDRKFIDYLKSITSTFIFFPVNEWFGVKVNTLITALPDQYGKPIAIFKTIKTGG